MLPDLDKQSLTGIVNYACASTKYLAAIETVAKRARYLAGIRGRTAVKLDDVKQTILDDMDFDSAFRDAISPSKRRRKSAKRYSAERDASNMQTRCIVRAGISSKFQHAKVT